MPPKTLFQHQQASYSKLLTSNLREIFLYTSNFTTAKSTEFPF